MNRPKIVGAAAATLAVTLLGAQPAAAAPAQTTAAKDCVVARPFGSCTSGSVGAYSNHTVWFEIETANGGCNYRVVDVNNSQVVRRGTVPIWQFMEATLSNVYSRYRLEMTCAVAGWGTIHGA